MMPVLMKNPLAPTPVALVLVATSVTVTLDVPRLSREVNGFMGITAGAQETSERSTNEFPTCISTVPSSFPSFLFLDSGLAQGRDGNVN